MVRLPHESGSVCGVCVKVLQGLTQSKDMHVRFIAALRWLWVMFCCLSVYASSRWPAVTLYKGQELLDNRKIIKIMSFLV